MQIEKRNIKDLSFYPGNPRQISKEMLESLKKSLSEFGIVDPLVINKDNQVIGGNQRLKVLQELGVQKVDVVVVDFPKSKEKALNIALNKIVGEFDEELLKSFIEEIEPLDLELTGLDDSEISLLNDSNIDVQEDDYVPENIEVSVQRGNIYQLGSHRLMCGDATIKENVEKLIDGQKADMVFTDPPYGVDLILAKGEALGFVHGKLSLKQRMSCKADRRLYKKIEGDDKPFDPTFLLPLAEKVFIFGANNFSDKLPVSLHWLVWDKKSVESERKNTFSDAELIWTNIKGISVKIYRWIWNGMAREGNRIDELSIRCHPTQKPVGLLVQIIKDYTDGNEIVLDLFGGSGSTLIACEKLNRICYMMEIDPYYCQVIIDRWEKFTNKKVVKL